MLSSHVSSLITLVCLTRTGGCGFIISKDCSSCGRGGTIKQTFRGDIIHFCCWWIFLHCNSHRALPTKCCWFWRSWRGDNAFSEAVTLSGVVGDEGSGSWSSTSSASSASSTTLDQESCVYQCPPSRCIFPFVLLLCDDSCLWCRDASSLD